MFRVILGPERNGTVYNFKVRLEGCPRSGLECIDWRRTHGLPEAPSSLIELPGIAFTDEDFCRSVVDKLNGEADVVTDYIMIYPWVCTDSGEVERGGGLMLNGISNGDRYLFAESLVVKNYLADPCAATAKHLIANIFGYQQRSREAAEARSAAILADKQAKEDQLKWCRDKLKDEIRTLTNKIAYLEGELAEAQEKIEELEEADA